jgi:hypothetical protein
VLLQQSLELAQVVLPEGRIVDEIPRALEPLGMHGGQARAQPRLDDPEVLLEAHEVLADRVEDETVLVTPMRRHPETTEIVA